MSLPNRLWRIARQRLRDGLDDAGRAARDARAELEDFLRDPQPPRRDPPRSASQPRPEPPHPYAPEYRELGAPIGSDLETVRSCWRRLAREHHPDRFPGDPVAQARANERIRRINEAYQRLRAYLSPPEAK